MISIRISIDTERELVAAAKSGDHEAFERLVKAYQDRLFNGIVQIVHSRDDAEDVVQDAFIQAYQKLASFRGKSSFYTWLYRIAVNLAFSSGRKRRTQVSLDQSYDVVGNEPLDPSGSPSQRMERREQVGQIRRALASLSDEHRTVLVLRGIEGFDYETIAEVLNLNPGTVRSRIHRARTSFKERLEDEALCGA
jgi:RNA polymerase sigma-70 factor (ECF subfamily)